MKKYLTPLFLFLGVLAYAQPPKGSGPNIIPNPSFEIVQGKKPADDLDGSGAFRINMVDWKSPTRTTPDLKIVLPSEIEKQKGFNAPYNTTHTGYKCVAILTHNPQSERSDTYREYIQVKLLEPTKLGKDYYYEFWVCRDYNAKFASNNIGFVLSPTPLFENSYMPLSSIQPDFNVTEIINKDNREWVKYSGIIKSANRSFYFVLGNFFDNEKTIMHPVKDPGTFENAYYWIDDVALHLVNPEPDPIPEPPIKVGEVVKLDRVFFVTAKWDLLPASNEQLNEVVELLNTHPGMEIAIHGHTDDKGDDNYNINLSHNRAKSVYNYLIKTGGIAPDRLSYEGFGERKPVADNTTSEGRQINRRVEFVVTKVGGDNIEVKYDTDVKPYTDNK
jgi:outer membrane protein OmpA-like peptidoglycan-associated protein